jgi:predicted esterase
MEEKSIKFNFESRYFQIGELSGNTEHLIFVLHGYGQQAKYFLRKFEILNNGKNCIIAPEGLSKFYLEGFSGRVGATWMTKENRMVDIKNYLAYLDSLLQEIKASISSHTKISIIGFSQGSATASRWIDSSTFIFDQLILWAGVFPPDVDFEKANEKLRDLKIYYVYGTEDPFITQERLNEMKDLTNKLNVYPDVITFEGNHDINKEVLTQLFL